MFWLICVTVNIQNARMQAWRCLRHWSMPLSVTLCFTHQSDAASNRSHPVLFLVDSLLQILYWNIFWSGLFGSQKSGSSYGSLTLLHFPTVRVDRAREKDNDQQNISKMIMWYRNVYNKTTIILFISSKRTNCNWC